MLVRLVWCLFVATFFSGGAMASAADPIDRFCEWPPVFQRQFGEPTVSFRAGKKQRVNYLRPLKRLIIRHDSAVCDREAAFLVRDHFLQLIWSQYLAAEVRSEVEREMALAELIPLDWPTFSRIGHQHLSGCSTGNSLHDAWWQVRMGEELQPCCDCLLSINSIHWAEGGGNQFGHFAIAMRERGGNPNGDYIIDFRAPWEKDRRSDLSDTFSSQLRLISVRENYYDWLSTQTRYRHCDVTATFAHLSPEQAMLLREYCQKTREAGEYGVAKANCATLGVLIINRLLPLDRRVGGEGSFLDLPDLKIQKAMKVMGGAVAEIEMKSETLEIGREISHRNVSSPAEPSREESEVYQTLLRYPLIN